MIQKVIQRGAMVSVLGLGILIQGPSGIGKSLAVLNLLRYGHKIVADELVSISCDQSIGLVGHAVEKNVRIEIRGLGVFRINDLFRDCLLNSSPLDFVVELSKYVPEIDSGRIEPLTEEVRMLDHKLEKIIVPIPTGMDPGFLVELIARAKMTGAWRKSE